MNARTESNWLTAFSKAPLALGLALALGGGLPWSAASASPASTIDANAPPAVRNALRFGDQPDALDRQLRHRGLTAPVAPHRPAGTVPVTN